MNAETIFTTIISLYRTCFTRPLHSELRKVGRATVKKDYTRKRKSCLFSDLKLFFANDMEAKF